MPFVRRIVAVAAALAVLRANAPVSAASSPAGEPVRGIRCEAMEGLKFHIHQHLAIYDHGRAVGVPSDIGRPLAAQCFYWLHTHTPDGIIHVESPVYRTFTLGDVFAVWGEPLGVKDVAGARVRTGERVVTYVNGTRYTGDPAKIELAQHTDIAIMVGPPYAKPAPFTEWNGN
jgi:hypothetical protein